MADRYNTQISSDAQIKEVYTRGRARFHRILLLKHPHKSSNPADHEEFKIANITWQIVDKAYTSTIKSKHEQKLQFDRPNSMTGSMFSAAALGRIPPQSS